MKKGIITLAIGLLFVVAAQAQDYSTGIGVRGGFSNGLTVKHFLSSKAAVEGILASRYQGFNITVLYEIHATAFDVDRLNWYYGVGGHIGFWNGANTPNSWGLDGTNHTVIGVDGILGIEYNIPDIPINISADWKPAFNLIGYSGWWGDGGAFSVRFIF